MRPIASNQIASLANEKNNVLNPLKTRWVLKITSYHLRRGDKSENHIWPSFLPFRTFWNNFDFFPIFYNNFFFAISGNVNVKMHGRGRYMIWLIIVLIMAKNNIISLILIDFIPLFFIINLFQRICRGSFRFKKIPTSKKSQVDFRGGVNPLQ